MNSRFMQPKYLINQTRNWSKENQFPRKHILVTGHPNTGVSQGKLEKKMLFYDTVVNICTYVHVMNFAFLLIFLIYEECHIPYIA